LLTLSAGVTFYQDVSSSCRHFIRVNMDESQDMTKLTLRVYTLQSHQLLSRQSPKTRDEQDMYLFPFGSEVYIRCILTKAS